MKNLFRVTVFIIICLFCFGCGGSTINNSTQPTFQITESVVSGETVQLRAIASNNRWQFNHWEGDVTGHTNPIQMTFTSPLNLKAVFTDTQGTLNMTLMGNSIISKEFTVQVTANGTTYSQGDSVVFAGSTFFDHWEGLASNTTQNPITVNLNSTNNITAVFEAPSNNTSQTSGLYFIGASSDGFSGFVWKDGNVTQLSDGGIPQSIFVTDNTVYIAGYYWSGNDTVACYWENGVKHDLSGSSALSIYVVGSDIYVSGCYEVAPMPNDDNQYRWAPCYWKNGVRYELTTPPNKYGQYGSASSIYIDGTDVYVAGWYLNTSPTQPLYYISTGCYWKNGTAYDTSPVVPQEIKVLGTDVYMIGGKETSNGGMSGYIKNGVVKYFSDHSSVCSMEFIGTDVYVGGTYWTTDSIGCVWNKDGGQYISHEVGTRFYDYKNGRTKPYILGVYTSNGSLLPCYWISETRYDLPTNINWTRMFLKDL